MRARSGPSSVVLVSVAFLAGCPHEGQTTTTRAAPRANANVTTRQDRDVQLTASVPVTRSPGPVRLPVTIHVENRGERRLRLREENLQLVGADGSMHPVARTQMSDGGQPGWREQILAPGERFDATVWFDDVNPLGEQLTLDAFFTDVETGERGPELAVPVKTRPDAVAADRTDAGGSRTQ